MKQFETVPDKICVSNERKCRTLGRKKKKKKEIKGDNYFTC